MDPRPDDPQLPALRREVERPGAGGHGLLPVVVLAAAMMSTLAAAALAMTVTPRGRHCPYAGHRAAASMPGLSGVEAMSAPLPVTRAAEAAAFARPVPPSARTTDRAWAGADRPSPSMGAAPAALDPACAPRVYHGKGDVQEWTFETCAHAPMPRHFVLSQP
ncbi:MAG TPA: hypothetical protein VHE35_36640 [Kofleriaceae bacterium]|nr:hypothetical protein [Kofleriaceae bacterium]